METEVTRSIEEQLSAFLDGELPEAELQLLVRRLERDQEYRETLARYAAIGGLLRRDPLQLSGRDLRPQLTIALQDEVPADPGQEAVTEKTLFPGQRALLAAAVAAVAILGVYTAIIGLPGSGIIDEPVVSQLAGGPEVAGRSSNSTQAGVSAVGNTNQRELTNPARQAVINPQRMTSYLVSHGQFSRSFQGPMVDSRIFVQQASFEK